MAQFSVSDQAYKSNNDDMHETTIIVDKDGFVYDSDNPMHVTLGSDSITITGNVNVGTTVEIANDEGNPIPINGTVEATQSGTWNVDISSIPEVDIKNDIGNPISTTIISDGDIVTTVNRFPVDITNQTITVDTIIDDVNVTQGTDPWIVDGTVALDAATLSALENINATITGDVNITNFPASQTVTGDVNINNFPASQTVTGTVAVTGTFWQASQTVDGTVAVTGDVNITNFPASQTVDGTVALDAATLSALENINIGTMPNVTINDPVAVTGTFWQATQAVTGDVNINNFPATQTVDGTVAVTGDVNITNFPATQTVDGTVAVTGDVNINNFPASQTVDGTVNINNFPATQTVDGTVAVTGTVALDAATLSALENINATITGDVNINNFPASQTVDGTVALDAATLSALENINATITGDVNINNFPASQTVDGTVALDAATLSALENINATITGDVNVTQGTDPWVVSGNINSTIIGSSAVGLNKPFYLEVAQGIISGYSFNHKFGAAPNMSIDTTGSVWDINDTIYPWAALDTPAVVNIERNDAADNGLIVTVQGLDSNWNVVQENITITGADQVGTTLFRRVNRAFVTDTGTSNVGDIDIEAGAAGGTTVARITAGLGQTLMGVYTIPAGKTAYLLKGNASAENEKDASGFMFVRYFEQTTFRVGHTFEFSGTGGAYNYEFIIPLPIPEKSDIDIRVTTRAKSGRYTVSFDVLLVDNI